MNTKIIGAAALAAGLTLTGAANAQTQDWSGVYAGVSAGYSQGEYDIQNAPLITRQGSGFWGPFGGTVANSAPKFDSNGGEYGLYGGINQQTGNIVWGAEVDGQVSDANDTARIADRPAAGTNQFTTRLGGDIQYSASVRGRVGYGAGPLLVYGTGGVGIVRAELERNYTNAAGAQLNDTGERTARGWVYGGGVEYKPGQGPWSVRAEYLRYDMNNTRFGTSYADGTVGYANTKLDRDLVRAGVSYNF